MSSELFSEIYNKALDILSRREHSVLELKQKLQKKFDTEYDIEETISRLKKNNLLDDYRFSESYVVYRKRKGFGPIKISNELKEKDIISMCGSGITACHNILALELIGIKNVKLYDGSWSEWITDPNRTVVTIKPS